MGNSVSDQVVNPFIEAVEDIAGYGVDFAEGIIQFAVDEILNPAMEMVGDTIEYAVDNPIEAAAMIAAMVMGLPPDRAAMLVGAGSGTQALVDGESLEDAIKAAVISAASTFVGETIGAQVAPGIEESVGRVIPNAKLAKTVATALTAGTEAGATNFVRHGNLGEAANAFLTAAAVTGTTVAADIVIDAATEKLGLTAATDAVMGNIDSALAESGFLDSINVNSINDLSQGIKDAISSGVAAELTGADVSSAMFHAASKDIFDSVGNSNFFKTHVGDTEFIQGIVDKFTPVAEYMQGFVNEFGNATNEYLTEAQIKTLTDSTAAAWDMAKRGNPELSGEAFFGKDGMGKLGYDYVLDYFTDPINTALDDILGNTTTATQAVTALDTANIEASQLKMERDGYVTTYGKLYSDLDELVKTQKGFVYSESESTPWQLINRDINAQIRKINAEGPALKTKIDAIFTKDDETGIETGSLITAHEAVKTAIVDYTEAFRLILTDVEDLAPELVKMDEAAVKTAAEILQPGLQDVDENKYRELNALDADADVNEHYLLNSKVARVFDPKDLNDAASDRDMYSYGEGYTAEIVSSTITDPVTGHSYDDDYLKYYMDTPDGKVEIDPYNEGVAAAVDGAWPLGTVDKNPTYENHKLVVNSYKDDELQLAQWRARNPVEFGARITADMADVLGDSSKQGQITTLNDYKTLKDAGYAIIPFQDGFTGERIDGTKSYDDILANFVQEHGRLTYTRPPKELNIDYEAQNTVVDEGLQNELARGLVETGGASNFKTALETIKNIQPVGTILGKDIGNDTHVIQAALEGAGVIYNANYDKNQKIQAALYSEDGEFTDAASKFLQNTTAVGLDAMGQLAQTFSYGQLLLGYSGEKVKDSWLYDLGEVLSETGQNIRTPAYAAKVAKLNADMGAAMTDATGFRETLAAIASVAYDNPTAFLTEYVASEIFQELPLLVASGGASLLVKGGLNVAKGAVGRSFATSVGTKTGTYAALTTAAVGDVAEAYGGAASSAYQESYDTYLKAKQTGLVEAGYSIEDLATALDSPTIIAEAETYATDSANAAGVVGAAMGMISLGIGGLELEKRLFGGKKAPTGFAKKMDDLYESSGLAGKIASKGWNAADVGVKEGFAELIEETVVTDFIEGRLSLIDPTRDVSGNVTAAAFLGFIAGGVTSSAILVGSDVVTGLSPKTNLFAVTNPKLFYEVTGLGHGFASGTYDEAGLNTPDVSIDTTTPSGADGSGGTGPQAAPTVAEIKTKLEAAGVTDADIVSEVTNVVHDETTTTKTEIGAAVKKLYPEITFSDEFMGNVVTEYAGATLESDLNALLETFINPKYTTSNEAKIAAEKEGVTLTDDQAAAFAGETAATDLATLMTTTYGAENTSKLEVEKAFETLGYSPSEAEILQFVGPTADVDLVDLLNTYVSKQITTTDTGDGPVDPITVDPVVDPITVDPITVDPITVDPVVDPTTFDADAAVKDLFKMVNSKYIPTDADINAFSPTDPLFLVQQHAAARYMTEAEVRAEYKRLGFDDVEQDDVDKFVGQFDPDADLAVDGSTFKSTRLGKIANYADENFEVDITDITDTTGVDGTGEIDTGVDGTGEIDTGADGTGEIDTGEIDTGVDGTGEIDTGVDGTGEIDTGVDGTGDGTEGIDLSDYVTSSDLSTAITEALSGLDTVSTDDVSTAITTALSGFNNLSPTDVSTAITTALSGRNNLSPADVSTAITTALSEQNNLSDADVTDIMNTVVGNPAVVDDPNTPNIDETTEASGWHAALARVEQGIADLDIPTPTDISTAITEALSGLPDYATPASVSTAITDALSELNNLSPTDVSTAITDALSERNNLSPTDVQGIVDTSLETVTSTLGDVDTAIGEVKTELQVIADYVGKPATDVTQVDVDFVADILAQGIVTEELTQEQLQQGDVNNDGVIDIADQILLEETLQGDQAATGMFLQQEQDTQATQDLITELNTQTNTNIESQAQGQALRDFIAAEGQGAFDGGKYTVTAPDPMNINYLYDIGGESVFATEQQAGLFASPYGGSRAQPTGSRVGQSLLPQNAMSMQAPKFAQGGQVEDTNDMLLRLLGEM